MALTRTKICGITNLGDAQLAVSLGAWALGLILWPSSPRACPPEAAEEIGGVLRRDVELVGVFVNATLDEVADAADHYDLGILQLHGDEGPIYCREAARRTGCRVMKAIRVKDAASVRDLGAFNTDFHMLDAHVAGARGGTGETFNWQLARGHSGTVPLVLSGGLDPENVAEAIGVVEPYAVDTASGTEASPGHKDPDKLRDFFRAVESTRQGDVPDPVALPSERA